MRLKLQSWKVLVCFLVCSLNLNAQSLVLTSASGTDNQTVCENSAITNIEYTIGDGATGAAISAGNLPVGVTGTFNAGVFTISGTPTGGISASYNYTITTTGGANAPVNLSGNIVIVAQPIASTSGFTTICSNEIATVSAASASNGTIAWTENGSGALTNHTTLTPSYTPTYNDEGNTVTLTINVTNSCGTATAEYYINVNPSPTVSGGGSITICPNETAIPSGMSAANGSLIWTHDGLGTFTSGATTLTPTYTPAGGDAGNTITLILTATSMGCTIPITATATYTINIQDNLGPILGGSNVCVGQTLGLTNQTTGGTWTSSDPSIATVDASGWVTGISQGLCDIMYTTNANGCIQTASKTVTINETPIITLTGNTNVCLGENILITASTTPVLSTYGWTGPNAYIGISTTLSFTNIQPYEAGLYTFTASSNGCSATESVNILVNSPITPTFTYEDTVCQGSTFILPTSSSNTPPISGTISPAFFNTNTLETITYTFTPNAGECATSTTLDITVIQCPGITATVTPTSVSENGICDGTANIEITSGSEPFNFTFSDGQTQIPASGLCEGLQTVTISDANGDTLVLNFLVPSPSNTTTTDNYLDSNLVDTVYNPAVTDCIINYLQIDSAQIDNYTILPNDSVSVTWTVYSSGTITTITDIYVLSPTAGIYMLALQIYCPQKTLGQFLVAYDQIYYNPASIGIPDYESESVSIAPNPFNDHLEIILENDEASEIMIHDITGKLVFSRHYHSQTINLDVQSLSAGQYILTIINGKTIVTKHIVK